LKFEIIGQIDEIKIIAVGTSIRDLAYLKKIYGSGRWRKLKGKAHIRLPNGNVRGRYMNFRISHHGNISQINSAPKIFEHLHYSVSNWNIRRRFGIFLLLTLIHELSKVPLLLR